MAINSVDKQCDKISTKYSFTNAKGNTLPSCHLVKLSVTTDGSITSSDSRSSKAKKGRNAKSPYLTGDSVQLLSRVTEKKLYAQHKKSDFVSSFPLAANIYRANSDEFKTQKRINKKVKKSVLTLPNAPTESPQTCTVSDTNDGIYVDTLKDNRNLKTNKRLSANNRKARTRNAGYEFYDRDARYCSQMNIHLDCSSSDMIDHFTGDGKRINKHPSRKEAPSEQEFNAHDVWAVLRNINRFQFRPSPPMSDDSIQTTKKKKARNKRKNNRKDTRVIETCRTEQFAYISSYDVDSQSPLSFSQSSSFDRITVIDKKDEFGQLYKEFEKRITTVKNVNSKKRLPEFEIPKMCNRNQNRKIPKKNAKKILQKVSNEQPGPQNIQREVTKSPDFQSVIKKIDNPDTLVGMTYNNSANPRKTNAINANKNVESAYLSGIVSQAKESNDTLHSGSSKAAVDIPTNCRRDYSDNLLNGSTSESGHQVKGITKVILSKGPNIMLPKHLKEIQNRTTRLDTTIPRATIVPKLTQNEIRRRLANLKFPIVILGKDQLCSTTVHAMSYEPPHLQGLDQPIWPFMKDWYNKEDESGNHKKNNGKPDEFNGPRNKNLCAERNKNLRKQNEATANKQSASKDKNFNEALTANKKKNLKRPLPPNEIVKVKPQTSKKPIHQLKDKMLKLLYKNTSAKEINEQYKNSGPEECVSSTVNIKPLKVEVSTETVLNYEAMSQTLSKNINVYPQPFVKKNLIIAKQTRGKANWASDFIETVIKKIRCGVYYNHDNKLQNRSTELIEASIQTILTGNNFKFTEQTSREETEVTITDDTAKKAEVTNDTEVRNETTDEGLPDLTQRVPNSYLKALPGFDASLPALEIKTLNMKEVAVKHCMTNVMIQFDISVPSEPEPLSSLQKSSTFVPLTVTESQTKIFKCKTTIINAMLPAEICSLLPKIMRTIIESNKSPPPVPSTVPYQTDCLLYTISELSNSESQDIIKPVLPPKVNSSSTLLNLTDGVFSSNEIKPKTYNLPALSVNDWAKVTNLLVDLSTRRLFPCDIIPLYVSQHKAGKKRIENNQNLNGFNNKSCTALELYRGTPLSIVFGRCHSRSLENVYNRNTNIQIKLFINSIPLMLTLVDHNITTSITNTTNDFEEKTSIIIDNTNNVLSNTPFDSIEENSHENNLDSQFVHIQNALGNLKTRKNKFVKLYKKCKSTSNISNEKNGTLLSKIMNLEDFLQAIGSGKILSSVFDGLSGKKILSSLLEMKCWITEISQRQAMLVLLLNNKKDTPNLVRFRPVLLQGIAVNRITRASELDMEIEVIETENFNKFSKASDYQKPFNEASEKLLKSLLEKRKKLNPSYLRVMARYVGLGLLKSSTKN